jgi:hypothetical protein
LAASTASMARKRMALARSRRLGVGMGQGSKRKVRRGRVGPGRSIFAEAGPAVALFSPLSA